MMSKESDFKIGIVDDNIQSAVSISNILEFQGFKTFQAYSADEIIELSNHENPDLLIVDVVLDGKSGFDIAEVLSKKKIILITAYEVNKVRVNKLKNVIAVLQKPLDNNLLISKVREFFKLPKSLKGI